MTEVFGTILIVIGVLIISPDALVYNLAKDYVKNSFWDIIFFRCGLNVIVLVGVIGVQSYRNGFGTKKLARVLYNQFTRPITTIVCTMLFTVNQIFISFLFDSVQVPIALSVLATLPFSSAVVEFFALGKPIPYYTCLCILVGMTCVILMVTENGLNNQDKGNFGLGIFSGVLGTVTHALWTLMLLVGDENFPHHFPRMAYFFNLKSPSNQNNVSKNESVENGVEDVSPPATDITNALPSVGFQGILSGIIALLAGARPTMVPPLGAFWLSISGLIILPLSFAFLAIGAMHAKPTTQGLCFLLETVFGTIWAWLAYGDKQKPSTRVIICGIILLASLATNSFIANRKGSETTQVEEDEQYDENDEIIL
eukprot:g610.t1